MLPALKPDVALFHAPYADEHGNVWLGARREPGDHGARGARDPGHGRGGPPGNLLADDARAAGTLPALYVTALAEARQGAWPLGLAGRYEPDRDHLADYARLAASEEGFARYCADHVTGLRAAE